MIPKTQMTPSQLRITALAIASTVLAAATLTYEHLVSVPPPLPPTLPTTTWSPFPPDYADKVKKITNLLKNAPTSQPSPADTNELFDEALHDPNFAIRVRAMALFPFLDNRERAIDILINCVHDRDPQTTGNGNVPLYATTYLADMKATRAIPDIKSWIQYQQQNQPYGDRTGPMIVNKSTEDLNRLIAASTQPITTEHDKDLSNSTSPAPFTSALPPR